jgi:3-oxoacyl-[acyl-carrier-protein] synthase II
MREATQVAGIQPANVHYINAHGTGTVLNDAAEAAAINEWAGEAAPSQHVSSTKALVGHLLGAAGAVEAAVCLMALQGQWLPPSITTGSVDPSCRFNYLTHPMKSEVDVALSNSFGFGGANATLIFRRWK